MSEDENGNAASDALQALARDLVEEIAAGRAIELAAGMTGQEVAAFGQAGSFTPPRDPYGQWQPPPPGPQAGWHHTLRNPANRGHLLGSDPFMNQLYGRTPGPGRAAAVSGQENPQKPPGTAPPPGPSRALDGFYEAARGVSQAGLDLPTQPHPDPAASPQRPPRDRYGRRTRRR